jgi:phosphate transport system substrate-binding protein
MGTIQRLFTLIFIAASITAGAQQEVVLAKANLTPEVKNKSSQKAIVVTGARFSYKLVQRWIDEYNKLKPEVQIIIESRGSADPASDILIEAYEQNDDVKKNREYLYVARYAVLPIATATSQFARVYGEKGLNREQIIKVFFDDIFADQEKEIEIKAPFTVYTRLQKAGAPNVFARHFGFEQKDIKGKAIAGADEHLLKALLRDSTGVSYLPLSLIYDHATLQPIPGITVLPVDVNGNGRVNDEEKFYQNGSTVIERLENGGPKELKNIPIEYLHLSVDKTRSSPQAVDFLKWVSENGEQYLHEFGYLLPESKRSNKTGFAEFASRRTGN